jgi:hypothetical protein
MQYNIFDILNYAGLKREEVENLDAAGIIRIEKKLKAAQKSNPAISADAVEKTLSALKTHPEQLKYCYSDNLLYHLFHRKSFKNLVSALQYMDGEPLEKMQEFSSLYLEDDLFVEFQELFKGGSLKELARWVKARNLFSYGFRQKFHSFLAERLKLIKEALELKPGSSTLRSKVPWSTSPHFYTLLGAEDDHESNRIVSEILRFYSQNKEYTKNRDYTDRMLVAMYAYKPDDADFQARVSLTGLTSAGSYVVAFKAAGVIILVVCIIMFSLFKCMESEGPPARHVAVDPLELRMQGMALTRLGNMLKDQARTQKDGNCENAFRRSDELINFESAAMKSFDYQISDTTGLKTGDNVVKYGKYAWDVKTGDHNVSVKNTMSQDVLLTVFVSTCYFKKYNAYFPCEQRIAYNKLYIAAGEALLLDHRFDSLAVQTGARLLKAEKTTSQNISLKTFAFCPSSPLDSILYSHGFVNYRSLQSTGGELIIGRSGNEFSVIWNGKPNTMYSSRTREYLQKGKAIVIREEKMGKKKKSK